MKSCISLLTTFVLLASMSGLKAAEANYAPVSVDMTVRQVSANVYYVEGQAGIATDNEGFISNAGFVVTKQGVVVFDALGTPSLAWALRQRIREITSQPVVKVVVSHYHADHIYGLQVFQDEGAEVIAPAGVYEYLDSAAAAERLDERRFSLEPWVNDETRLVIPDLIVTDQWSFTAGDIEFRLNFLGSAHSDGDLSMYVVQDKVLFSGDIIFEGRVPFVGDADTRHWLEAIKAMQTDGLNALVPGHGPAATKPNEALSLTREYLSFLRDTMGQAVEELQQFSEAYDAADWSRFENLPAFEAANRRNAYQVYLSLENETMSE